MADHKILTREQNKNQIENALHKVLRGYITRKEVSSINLRNICVHAQISTSSFYNLYTNFDSFLADYFYTDYLTFFFGRMEQNPEFEKLGTVEKIVALYCNYSDYCEHIGYEVISPLYNSFNKAFTLISDECEERGNTMRLYTKVFHYIELAKDERLIDRKYDTRIMCLNMYFSLTGLLYNWCITQGKVKLTPFVKSSLTAYFKEPILGFYYKSFIDNSNISELVETLSIP